MTGGAGYVGSHVVVELAHAGYAPVVLDNFVNSTPAVLPRLQAIAGRPVPCVTADVRDVAALRAVFHDHPIAAVVHCAGLKSVGESEARPLAYYDVNVGGAIALAEVMGEAGVATLVFSSSASVYGQPDDLPVTEDAAAAPAQRLRAHEARGRGLPPRPGARQRQLAHRGAALLQPGRRALLRDAGRGDAREAEQPDAAAVQDRGRRTRRTRDLRRGLADARRHGHPRLPARAGPGRRSRRGAPIPRQDAGRSDAQPRHRASGTRCWKW